MSGHVLITLKTVPSVGWNLVDYCLIALLTQIRSLLQRSWSLQTDRQTDRPRYTICSNRPHL